MVNEYQLRCGWAAVHGTLTMDRLKNATIWKNVKEEGNELLVEIGYPIAITAGGLIVQIYEDLNPIIAQKAEVIRGTRPAIPIEGLDRVLRDPI